MKRICVVRRLAWRFMRAVLALAVALLTGCASHSVRSTAAAPAVPAPDPASFIDLQAGWRLHVVTPLTKSGGYVLHSTKRPKVTSEPGKLAFTLPADPDFIGYQTAFYAVEARRHDGVRIAFTSAQDTKRGVTIPQAEPRPLLFQLPNRARYVRLVYLARVSRADHDMAVVASTNRVLLDLLTIDIQAHPAACVDAEHTFCSWIPAGIAVQPEVPKTVNGAVLWQPAR
jgi:hypothetical protein